VTGIALPGARVIVTGAAGTIGAALCAGLAEKGALVAGLDLVVPPAGIPGCRHFVGCDITDGDAVDQAVRTLAESLGGIDVVVNCAGIGEPTDAGKAPGPETERIFAVNLFGPWRVTAAAMPWLLDSAGHVVVVSSVLAYLPVPLGTSYAVSKRALSAWADSLRGEYGSRIRVSTVYPGHIESPIHEKARASGLSMDGRVPFERPSDVVRTVLECLTSERPIADRATTPTSRTGLRFARFLPRLTARLTEASTEVLVAAGKLDGLVMAKGLAERTRGRTPQRGDALARAVVAAGTRLTLRRSRGSRNA
jgi:NAD(P)-dependent dehydrogenase (short-subunit alcohol dehydrogenase family)